jgi:hypothetical protein
MSNQEQQEGYLASVAQAVDAGEFDYLPPQEMQSLNDLIAAAWHAFREGKDVDTHIDKIEQAIGHKN